MSVQWLADYLGAENLVILDAGTLGLPGAAQAGFLAGHVPGAVFADVAGKFTDPACETGIARPTSERFELAAAAVGVWPNSTVIVYDNAGSQLAAHLWWLFRCFGFDQVAVLDGGLSKWRRDGRPIETGSVTAPTGSFTAIERPGLWADADEGTGVAAGTSSATLVTLSGTSRIIDPASQAFRSRAALIKEFGPQLTAGTSRLLVHDTDLAAAAGVLALTLAGHSDVALLAN